MRQAGSVNTGSRLNDLSKLYLVMLGSILQYQHVTLGNLDVSNQPIHVSREYIDRGRTAIRHLVKAIEFKSMRRMSRRDDSSSMPAHQKGGSMLPERATMVMALSSTSHSSARLCVATCRVRARVSDGGKAPSPGVTTEGSGSHTSVFCGICATMYPASATVDIATAAAMGMLVLKRFANDALPFFKPTELEVPGFR